MKTATAVEIRNCNYLQIKPNAIIAMAKLELLKISNVSYLSIEEKGLLVSITGQLEISISNSTCDDYLPNVSKNASYAVILQNVKIQKDCTCKKDFPGSLCQIGHKDGEMEYDTWESFDQENCTDHSSHSHPPLAIPLPKSHKEWIIFGSITVYNTQYYRRTII